MYARVYMSGRSINKIMEDIFDFLEKEGELSIRQLSIKVNSQWITVEKALTSMKKLGIVKERVGDESKRKTRLFSVIRK